MIIACPACATRYVVPDSAIGADGRTVRCAKCRHSWYQDGPLAVEDQPLAASVAEPAVESDPAAEPPQPALAANEPDIADPPLPEPIGSAEPAAVYADDGPESYYQDEAARSNFDFEPPFRPRRNRTRMWLMAALLFALVSLAAVGAVARYGLPDWVPLSRPTFAQAQPELVLDFPAKRQDRRTLPNGAEFFGASGTVTNVGQTRRDVPTILIVLRDGRDRIVYSWEVVPPKRQLGPGESVTINEAVTDVPKSAKAAEIGWKPG